MWYLFGFVQGRGSGHTLSFPVFGFSAVTSAFTHLVASLFELRPFCPSHLLFEPTTKSVWDVTDSLRWKTHSPGNSPLPLNTSVNSPVMLVCACGCVCIT